MNVHMKNEQELHDAILQNVFNILWNSEESMLFREQRAVVLSFIADFLIKSLASALKNRELRVRHLAPFNTRIQAH